MAGYSWVNGRVVSEKILFPCRADTLNSEKRQKNARDANFKEETDLDGVDFNVVSLTNDIAYGKHYITIGVVAKTFFGEAKIMEPEKCESWEWYDVDALPQSLFAPSAAFLDNFLENIFYK